MGKRSFWEKTKGTLIAIVVILLICMFTAREETSAFLSTIGPAVAATGNLLAAVLTGIADFINSFLGGI